MGAVVAWRGDRQGRGIIRDDDPTPALTIGDPAVTETNDGFVFATFTVRLSHASGQPVTVHYATADGSAPADYVAAASSLTFAPGQTFRTVRVQVRGDLLRERAETFFVNLSLARHATPGDGQGVGTIRNND